MSATHDEQTGAESLTVESIRHRATLSVEETGEVLGVGRTAAYAAVKRGEIPTIRLGRRIRVPVLALLRLLGDGTVHADGPMALQVQRTPSPEFD